MSKPRIDTEDESIVIRFMNWLAQMIDMIKPTNLYLILGRAGAKSVGVLAKRFKDMSYELPGAFISLSADTYMNAVKNIVPQILLGWQLNGWIEDIHYVVDKRPPPHFKKPYKTVLEWKHTITTHTGTHFKIISQDRPSAGAGDSYMADAGDEAKYLQEKKLNKVTQASRGEAVRYQHSPYYLGSTYVTDMPNLNLGEHDWILSKKDLMDSEQIQLILQVAFVLNDIKIELIKAENELEENPHDKELKKNVRLIKANKKRWEARYNKVRMNSTFFYIGSSYVNADVLTEKFFHGQFEKYDFKELMTALLSIAPTLEKGLMFYPNLSEDNFYSDGFTYDRIDKLDLFTIQDEEESSLDLRYVNSKMHLEAGFDSGNMCSLVVGQEQGKIYRGLKEFWTLPEDFINELGEQFVKFFKYHENKHLLLFHDRATNKWKSVGEDHASKLKKAIEFHRDGTSTGWTVQLMNEKQGNIDQQIEYELMLEMQSGKNRELPYLLIDKHNCPCWKSSMERAQKIIRTDLKGNKTIHKDKSSEKLRPYTRLLLESTNMSDAGKYLLCRPEYLEKINADNIIFSSNPSVK